MVFAPVSHVLRKLARSVPRFDPQALNVQIGRSLIALAQLLTLTLTSWTNLTATLLGTTPHAHCVPPRQLSTFCLGQQTPTGIGQWVGIAILLLVMSGFFPRYVAFLHVWLSISMNISLSLPDGGEAVASFATIFIALITLADSRICAWRPPRGRPNPRLQGIAYAAVLALNLQLAGLYLESGLSKIAVPEWLDGSAMYFVLRDPYFGASGFVGTVMRAISNTALGTAALTWGTIVLECTISVLLLSSWRWKKYALVLIITLHLGIAICLGLWSFALIMVGTATVAAYSLRPRALPTHTPDALRPVEAIT